MDSDYKIQYRSSSFKYPNVVSIKKRRMFNGWYEACVSLR